MFAGIRVAVVWPAGAVPPRRLRQPRRLGILGGAAMVCPLGVADDIWDLDWMTKLIGQVLAAGLIVWQGVRLISCRSAG